MFEVGFSEILLILGLALLVLGPEKLPGLAAKVGRWTGRARSMARQLRMQLEQEVNLEEMAKSRPMQAGPQQQSQTPPHSTPTEPPTPMDHSATEVHPAEVHPAEVHPAEVHPEEVHPEEVHPAEIHPAETRHEAAHEMKQPVEAAAADSTGVDRVTAKSAQ